MTRLPQVLRNVRGRRPDRARRRRGVLEPGPRRSTPSSATRPGARAPVGHRAGRAGDGRGDRPTTTRPTVAAAPGRTWSSTRRAGDRRRRRPKFAHRCAESSAWCAAGRRESRCPTSPPLARRGRRGARRRSTATDGLTRASARRPRRGSSASTPTLRGAPGVHALLADPSAARRASRTGVDRARRRARPRSRPSSTPGRAASSAVEIEARQRGAACMQGRGVGARARPARHRPRRRRPRRATRGRTPARSTRTTRSRSRSSALDRLEVRGRDSAGLHVSCTSHGLDLDDARRSPRARAARRRPAVPLRLGARVADGTLSFVYKTAAEIGELGDNTARLRAAIRGDDAAAPRRCVGRRADRRGARPHALGERRHHLRGQRAPAEPGGARVAAGARTWSARSTATSTTTPTSRRSKACTPARDHHRRQGDPRARVAPHSDATGASTTARRGVPLARSRRSRARSRSARRPRRDPERAPARRCAAAARRSTSGSPTTRSSSRASRTASVEESDRYLRLDGETPADADRASATQGQVVVLDAAHAGRSRASRAPSYDGTRAPGRRPTSSQTPRSRHATSTAVTFPHFLLKEISEAPASFRKTLRGRIVERDGVLDVRARRRDAARRPRARCATGAITPRARDRAGHRARSRGRASRAIAARRVGGRRCTIEAMTATELSGFELDDDMRDTLVVAISQTGTTTDTNRTVDLARARGASVVAIVNRRQSDLVDKSDGVLYTSDGRDVEMAVPSTKAFYAQVAAGYLLALALAAELGDRRRRRDAQRARSRAAGAARRDARGARRSAKRSRRSRSATCRRAGTGRWSATASTTSRPTSCASSSRSSVTSRSRATSPRTRSTSTSRPSR